LRNLIAHSRGIIDGDSKCPRKVWVEPPIRENATDCLIFLDAEIYMDRVKAPEIIRAFQATGQAPPIASVYLSYLDGAARHADFTCNKAFSRFLAMRNILAYQKYLMPRLWTADRFILLK
jgi:enterochelin esterase-like enzyme